MESEPSPHSPNRSSVPGSSEQARRRLLYYGVGACLVLLTFLAAWSRLRQHILSTGYLPHFYCYLGSGSLVWSHVIADSLIGVSYLAISITLAYFVYRGRREIPFHWMFLGLRTVHRGLRIYPSHGSGDRMASGLRLVGNREGLHRSGLDDYRHRPPIHRAADSADGAQGQGV